MFTLYPPQFIPVFKLDGNILSSVVKYCPKDAALCQTKHPEGDAPINDWDVSDVTSMHSIFKDYNSFAENDLSKWDVSKCTSFNSMFFKAKAFNDDISTWNTAKAKDMEKLFLYAESFNGDLSKWDVSEVTNFMQMFYNAVSFTGGDLSNWDVSKCTTFNSMFYEAKTFNGDISTWNPASTNLFNSFSSMLYNTPLFTQTLCGHWKTSTGDKTNMFVASNGKLC